MRRQTRRTFLTTVGAAGAAGLAGCAGIGGSDENSSSTTSSTSKGTDKSTTSSTKGDDETTTSKEDGGQNQQNGPQTFEDFEKLNGWSAIEGVGKLKASKKTKYQGSQSAHIMGSQSSKVGQIHRVNFGSKPANFKDKNLSIAVKCDSHQYFKIGVELWAPDRGHVVTLKRSLYGPKGEWIRVNLGTTGQNNPKGIDLSTIYEMRITGRPKDSNTTQPIDLYVDDVKTVPAPDKGMVMLCFNSGLDWHYKTAYPMMKKYDFPGVDAIITDAVYDDGYLTQTQMRKMVKNGWNMICQPATQSKQMDQRSRKNQEQLMKSSQDWLKRYGYDGHKYMSVPKNVVGPNTFELAQKHFDLTMNFGGAPNALPVVQKDTIISNLNGDSSCADLQAVHRLRGRLQTVDAARVQRHLREERLLETAVQERLGLHQKEQRRSRHVQRPRQERDDSLSRFDSPGPPVPRTTVVRVSRPGSVPGMLSRGSRFSP